MHAGAPTRSTMPRCDTHGERHPLTTDGRACAGAPVQAAAVPALRRGGGALRRVARHQAQAGGVHARGVRARDGADLALDLLHRPRPRAGHVGVGRAPVPLPHHGGRLLRRARPLHQQQTDVHVPRGDAPRHVPARPAGLRGGDARPPRGRAAGTPGESRARNLLGPRAQPA